MSLSLDSLLFKEGSSHIEFIEENGILFDGQCLDIWKSLENPPTVEVRTAQLRDGELESWLLQEQQFRELRKIRASTRLRLLCYKVQKQPESDVRMDMSEQAWDLLSDELDLPRSYAFDLSSHQHVPIRVTQRGPRLGFIFQSPALRGFMSLALSYNSLNSTTSGFLAYSSSLNPQSDQYPGDILIETIQNSILFLASQLHHPMLLPALSYKIWVDFVQYNNELQAQKIRDVQGETGLLEDYGLKDVAKADDQVERQGIVRNTRDYHSAHQKIVSSHTFLTNGLAEFISGIGPSAAEALDLTQRFGQINGPQPTTAAALNDSQIRQFVKQMDFRASVEMQHRQRMIDRVQILLQVLYNLMQQEMSIETQRDSTQMKSITVLTMVFLPATAIATIISPFININDSNHLNMTPQFWIFWAITVPVTLLVLLGYVLWMRHMKRIKETFQGVKHAATTTSRSAAERRQVMELELGLEEGLAAPAAYRRERSDSEKRSGSRSRRRRRSSRRRSSYGAR